jgi:DNA-binding NtrC family response regulator
MAQEPPRSRLLFCDDRRGALDGFVREVAAPLGERVEARTVASLDGFRELVAAGETFDVVVSDLNFETVGGGPKDGLLILAEARRAMPDAELLLLTAYSGSLTFGEGLELARAGLARENVFEKAADDDPQKTWKELRERIAGLLQARVAASERAGELLAERKHLRSRGLAETIRAIASRPVAESAAEIRADASRCLHGLVGQSFALRDRIAALERIAKLQHMALVTGETGTGKELVARALHRLSPRAAKPLVKSDLAAISRELVASELFGHERGAFTGALTKRRGLFAEADGGTIFLDEIGNLGLDLQPLLLRVLQDRTFRALGGEKDVKVDVFVIAATNADLEQLVSEGRFRADLLERLAVHQVALPPLRERREDVPLIAAVTLDALRTRLGVPGFSRIEADALDLLAREPWPRNVRQLENALERMFGEFDAATDPVTVTHVRRVLPVVPTRAASGGEKPLVKRVLDGEESLTLKEIGQKYGSDALAEVIEATFRQFRGPPDDEIAARLFHGMKANAFRQYAFQRGFTWERIRRGESGPATGPAEEGEDRRLR